ncbi:hypothetical protein DTO169C6_8452 [Paecilomyces variotii]|nr:hypothetical protein DTO169C6_8452 [Paecilomyces variotii]KAJ9357785.1 hypothetical protein DTO027B9_2712 [Paecilomyces variotii]KAJ9405081.1 hypothetical protein DTO045G8_7254 [Paecilomyces variotii]
MAAQDVAGSRYTVRENGNVASMELATGVLAAQLAPHLSQASQQHQFNRETFSQLRKELLEGRCSQLNLEDSVTDVNNLVCIVVKAGLEIGHRNGHLSIASDVDGQVLDCLDIIQAAVEKVPQVLLEFSNNEILGKDISAPLYFWLVIRMFAIQAFAFEDLQFLYFRSTANFHKRSRRSFAAELERLDLTPELANMNMILGPFPRVIVSVLELSSALLPVDVISTSNGLSSVIRHDFAWILDVYVQLWHGVVAWEPSTEKRAQLHLHFLEHLGICCDASALLSEEFSLEIKAICIRLRCVADILSSSAACQDSNVQLACRQAVESTAKVARRSAVVATYMGDILLPVLGEIGYSDTPLQSVKLSLKELVLSILSEALHNTPNYSKYPKYGYGCQKRVLDLPGGRQTEDGLLEGGKTPQGSPARKRIRLSKEQPEPPPPDALQTLLCRVYNLLGCEAPGSLEDLPSVAQEKFPPLSDENKCALVTNLGMIACAGATGLSGTHDGPDSELAPCCICDMNTPEEQALVPWCSPGFSANRVNAGIAKDSRP